MQVFEFAQAGFNLFQNRPAVDFPGAPKTERQDDGDIEDDPGQGGRIPP